MKQGKTLLGISAAVAIAIATASTVYAEGTNHPNSQGAMMDNSSAMMHGQKGNMGDKSSRMSGQKGMMGSHGNMMKMMSGEKGMMNMMGNSKAHMDKRLTKARHALDLTRNQLPAWNAYVKAVRAQVNFMSTRMKQMRGGEQSSTTVDQRATMMNSQAGRMQETATAAKNLYQKLTPAQRIKANRLLPIPCNRS
jgi:hypothetical protein